MTKELSAFKVGDFVEIEQEQYPQPIGRIVRFFEQGCALHGEPIAMVEIEILRAGHNTKLGGGRIYHANQRAFAVVKP